MRILDSNLSGFVWRFMKKPSFATAIMLCVFTWQDQLQEAAKQKQTQLKKGGGIEWILCHLTTGKWWTPKRNSISFASASAHCKQVCSVFLLFCCTFREILLFLIWLFSFITADQWMLITDTDTVHWKMHRIERHCRWQRLKYQFKTVRAIACEITRKQNFCSNGLDLTIVKDYIQNMIFCIAESV